MSSRNNLAIDEVWEKLLDFKKIMLENSEFDLKRSQQQKIWMWHYINNYLLEAFNNDDAVKSKRNYYEKLVISGHISPGAASDQLLREFFQNKIDS